MPLLFGSLGVGLLQGTADKAVLETGYDAGYVVAILFLKRLAGLVRGLLDFIVIRERRHCPVGLLVVLYKFKGHIAAVVAVPHRVVFLYQTLDLRDKPLYVFAVIDMDVLAGPLGVAIYLNYLLQYIAYSLPGAGNHRHNGKAQHLPKTLVVQLVPAFLKLVVHIQSHHYARVHINQLSGQKQVALQIAGIHDIEHQVGLLVHNIIADVELFRRIFSEGIGARQVHKVYGITLMMECAYLGIYRDAAVVAHLLVKAGGKVEEGCLAAVWIAHQSHFYVPGNLFYLR